MWCQRILSFLALWVYQSAHALVPSSKKYAVERNVQLWASSSSKETLNGLNVAVVGGGPSGLLLTHRLLKAGASKVSLYEGRPRPTKGAAGSRAYALGIGIRGRTAIKSVDTELWAAVKAAGYASERFQLHAGPLTISLRSEKDGEGIPNYEPSLLIYQSELCRTLTDELDTRWSKDRLQMKFDCEVTDVDLDAKTIATADTTNLASFDLVVGCDGVKSAVRQSLQQQWDSFESHVEVLPGKFSVVRLPQMPPELDSTAVALLLPKAGTCSAFVEPTANGEACILFAGNNSSDPLLASENVTEIEEIISGRFPKLVGSDLKGASQQLAALKPSQASLVTCNTYHYSDSAALVGDAAHATGGVSGQGVNSAFVDASVLSDCLEEHYDAANKVGSLEAALMAYSCQQVPEGKALYDLSFGPKPTSIVARIRVSALNALDFVFKGRLGLGRQPLQTLLATTLQPFSGVRRELNGRYDEDFPSEQIWKERISLIHSKTTNTPGSR